MRNSDNQTQPGRAIRPIRKDDNVSMARVIREVMTEFGAVGSGFSIEDPEVDDMHGAYSDSGHCFNVLVDTDGVVGGAGVAPLEGGPHGICELRKMYVLPQGRGIGAGRELLQLCVDQARALGFEACYLETLDSMEGARRLYQAFGFQDLPGPMGDTGHGGCDRWMLLSLSDG
ncbi:MAG: GNAT family N-acetyltransferase [Planctomycetota bacterium]|nr:GNAT family N-acetyltransferase [Planctomycetota bacterium]